VVCLAGAVWGAEQRSLEGGARSALRDLTHGNCPSAASEASGASFAVRPRGEQRRGVGLQGRPPRPAPARRAACRDARCAACRDARSGAHRDARCAARHGARRTEPQSSTVA